MPGPAPSVNSPFRRCGYAACELRHFEAALQVAERVRNGLAVLHRDEPGQLFAVGVGELEKLHHHPGARLRVLRRPPDLGGLGIGDRLPDFACRGERDLRLHLAGVGIEDVAEAAACRPGPACRR